ncbi:MAG: transposase [Planctomycetia bacterium]|nr:transposase [Planctomycetia bacterium]
MDETPTKQANQKAWLWTAVARLFAVFAIFSSHKGDALPKLLGDNYGGIIHCDRAKMYWQAERLQWCWAHLKRDIQALIDHPDHQVQRLEHDLMRPVKLMFQHWRNYKSGEIDWRKFGVSMSPIREKINGLLQRGAFSGNDRLVGMCKELHNHREWLWTFVDNEDIEPTNDTAERALRPAVIYRKLSFGTQSESGSRFLERILTVSETCRLRNRSIYDYLVTQFRRQAAALIAEPPRRMSFKRTWTTFNIFLWSSSAHDAPQWRAQFRKALTIASHDKLPNRPGRSFGRETYPRRPKSNQFKKRKPKLAADKPDS